MACSHDLTLLYRFFMHLLLFLRNIRTQILCVLESAGCRRIERHLLCASRDVD